VKPDQLIKRRGKLGLIKVNVDLAQVQEWVNERIDKDVQVFLFLKLNYIGLLRFNFSWQLKCQK
jgi:succinyl-CoA synthetase beta subunit